MGWQTFLDTEREEREKIIKENEISKIIDEEKKNRKEILGMSTFFYVQIKYLWSKMRVLRYQLKGPNDKDRFEDESFHNSKYKYFMDL